MKQPKKSHKKLSRRKFVATAGAAAAGFTIVPRHVLGRGFVAPSDKMNIGYIGVGGKGTALRKATKSQNVVALCDVDDKRAAEGYKENPKAKRYHDFRKMLEAHQNDVDGVMIATPDHTHAVIGMAAIQMGKHVYIEKPLTHNIYETRMLTKAAKDKGIVTQMGNQGSSGDGIRKIQEWINAGLIGDVEKVDCWTNRPVWPQGVPIPTATESVPDTLKWDLWLGPSKQRGYNSKFLPFKWRGFWDWGTGALGDMGCHILDPVVKALQLGYPDAVECSVGQVYVDDFKMANFTESCPPSSKIHLFFPQRGAMPAVQVNWMDGGIMPQRPEELLDDDPIDFGGGCVFHGTKGKIMCDTYGRKPRLLPTKLMKTTTFPKETIQRVQEGHEMNWVNACKANDPDMPSSNFEYAGKLTEIVLMGNLAIRAYNYQEVEKGKEFSGWGPFPGRIKLDWDGPNMRITNFDAANQFVSREYRNGWSLGV